MIGVGMFGMASIGMSIIGIIGADPA